MKATRITALFAIIAGLFLSQLANGQVIARGTHFVLLQECTPSPGGFTSCTVKAGVRTGTDGDFVKNFTNFAIEGTHQVWGPAGPSPSAPGGFGWNESWTSYDSHFLFTQTDAAIGGAHERNDGSNPRSVTLEELFGAGPTVGLGNLVWGNGSTDGFSMVGRALVVNLAQVVLANNADGTPGMARMRSTLSGSIGGQTAADSFDNVRIGITIPEPTSGLLFGLAALGMLAIRRRRQDIPLAGAARASLPHH